MQATDREQFDVQLAALCAGYNVPLTEARREAYWRGLQKMHLGQFARVVDHALGEKGPEKIPTARDVWTLHRDLRQSATYEHTAPPAVQHDDFHCFGQRALMVDLQTHGPAAPALLGRLIAAKNRVVDAMRIIHAEEPVTAEEMRTQLQRDFARVRLTP